MRHSFLTTYCVRFRSSYGSGGSTNVQGLDYRFDVSRSSLNGFTDDTNTKTLTSPAN